MKTKNTIRISLFVVSFLCVESFVKPLFFVSKKYIPSNMCKHNFADLTKNNTSISDKYYLIHSLLNHVVYNKKDTLYNYYYNILNYTDIMHIMVSSDLEYIIKKHYDTKKTLELYDIIKNNSKLTDCYVKLHTLNNVKKF
jgi:hypothetical protein